MQNWVLSGCVLLSSLVLIACGGSSNDGEPFAGAPAPSPAPATPPAPGTPPATDPYLLVPSQYSGHVSASGRDSAGNTFSGEFNVTLAGGGPAPDRTDGADKFAIYTATASSYVTNTYAHCQQVSRSIPVNVGLTLRYVYSLQFGSYLLGATPGEVVTTPTECDTGTQDVPILFAFQTQCDGVIWDDTSEQFTYPWGLSGHKTVTCAAPDGIFSYSWTIDWALNAPLPTVR